MIADQNKLIVWQLQVHTRGDEISTWCKPKQTSAHKWKPIKCTIFRCWLFRFTLHGSIHNDLLKTMTNSFILFGLAIWALRSAHLTMQDHLHCAYHKISTIFLSLSKDKYILYRHCIYLFRSVTCKYFIYTYFVFDYFACRTGFAQNKTQTICAQRKTLPKRTKKRKKSTDNNHKE